MNPLRFESPTALVLAVCAVAQTATAQQSTFPEPTYGGYPVAYCGAEASSCGQRAATAWCRTMRYDFASEWAARSGGHEDTKTIRLDDGTTCRGASCRSFAFITCKRQSGGRFHAPRLGADGKATLFQSGPGGALVAHAVAEGPSAPIAVPGCREREPGVYTCTSTDEYHNCRTLMHSGRVHSCRAELSFDAGIARPAAAAAGDYRLEVESTAMIRVERGHRGEGRVRGTALVDISFRQPTIGNPSWCDYRDEYVFHTTGPRGGTGETGDRADCDTPISVEVEPDEDDLLVAYDMCDAFAAWGGELTHSLDVVVAGLYRLGSRSPEFTAEFGDSFAVVAPYAEVDAPLAIQCRR